ncbi:MAG TPA: hypothetical protein VGC74_17515 [Stenotrophomonas sp.]|jgi:hypothetical protein
MTPSPAHPEEPDAEVIDAVLAYLRTHPDAADTLHGITRWWLPQQRYERAHGRIEAALQRLAERGRLQVRHLPDGTALYALGTPPHDDPFTDLR